MLCVDAKRGRSGFLVRPRHPAPVGGVCPRRRPTWRRSDKRALSGSRHWSWHRRHMWEPLPRRQVRPRRLRYSEVVGEDGPSTGDRDEPGTEPPAAARAQAPGSKDVPCGDFRFEDHPADVIIHSWGGSLEQAFAAAARGMFAYMTDLSRIEPKLEAALNCSGSGDERSALEGFLEACLEEFNLRGVIPCRLEDVRVMISPDERTWHASAQLLGDRFDRVKHSQVRNARHNVPPRRGGLVYSFSVADASSADQVRVSSAAPFGTTGHRGEGHHEVKHARDHGGSQGGRVRGR